MAWIVRRQRGGREQCLVAWRDLATRKVRSRLIPPARGADRVTQDMADRQRRAVEAREEAAPIAPRTMLAPADAAERFIASLEAQGRRPATVRYYRGLLAPIALAWAGRPMSTWARADLDAWMAAHPEWAPRRRQMLAIALRTWRRWALATGLLMADPTAGYRPPLVRPRERTPWTGAELARILKASIGTRMEVPVHLGVYAGLARSDLEALTWEQVDLSRGWLKRRRTKTGETVEVPLAPPLLAVLRRHRAASGPVCAGWYAHEQTQHKAFRRLCRAARVPRRPGESFHHLRHSYASLLAGQGVSVADLRAFLGHRPGSAVTLRYLHPDRARMEAAARALAKCIGKAR